jgi:hypothetical protein
MLPDTECVPRLELPESVGIATGRGARGQGERGAVFAGDIPGEGSSGCFGRFGQFLSDELAALTKRVEAARSIGDEGDVAIEDIERFDLIGKQEAAISRGGAVGVIAQQINAGRVERVGNVVVDGGSIPAGKPEPKAVQRKNKVFHGNSPLGRELFSTLGVKHQMPSETAILKDLEIGCGKAMNGCKAIAKGITI